MKKDCYNCKFIEIGWYQNHQCKCPNALIDLEIDFDEIDSVGYPSYKRVYPDQTKDCKYFEEGFLVKLFKLRKKILRYFYEKRLQKYKDKS
jgi:hypothetical protein